MALSPDPQGSLPLHPGGHHQIKMCMIRARTRDDLFLTLFSASTLPHLLQCRPDRVRPPAEALKRERDLIVKAARFIGGTLGPGESARNPRVKMTASATMAEPRVPRRRRRPRAPPLPDAVGAPADQRSGAIFHLQYRASAADAPRPPNATAPRIAARLASHLTICTTHASASSSCRSLITTLKYQINLSRIAKRDCRDGGSPTTTSWPISIKHQT
jgi:hypothetical protein